MPKISSFYGIIIKMYFTQREHNLPHLHAVYNECLGSFDLNSGDMYEGDLPLKAKQMVSEWILLHKEELQNIWETQEFRTIEGLE